MKTLRLVLFLVISGAELVAQAKPAAAAPGSPVLLVSDPIYPMPDADRLTIRGYQIEIDELEIDNQKMLLKIEQNRKRQSELWDAIKRDAFEFSRLKKIDLGIYELDPKEIKFVRKKAK
jgi:hypothetical protein